MLDVYFTPLIDLEQLAKDENITITGDEIEVDWDGQVYSCAIADEEEGDEKVFHLYGWNMGVYYYLYYKYGYLFNQDIIETPMFEKYVKDDVLDIFCDAYKKACLEEMKGRLVNFNGPQREAVLKKIEEDLKKYSSEA